MDNGEFRAAAFPEPAANHRQQVGVEPFVVGIVRLGTVAVDQRVAFVGEISITLAYALVGEPGGGVAGFFEEGYERLVVVWRHRVGGVGFCH